MEQFVRAITAGGVALVAGLWLATAFEELLPWVLGVALVVAGVGGLAAGIWSEVDY